MKLVTPVLPEHALRPCTVNRINALARLVAIEGNPP